MNIKHNKNYFQKGELLKYVGAAMAVLGAVMFLFGWSYLSYILSLICIPAGLILFFVGVGGRSNDSDLDQDIRNKTEGFEVQLEEDKKYSKRILKHLPPVMIEGYEYTDGLMFAKAKNGTVRSSEFTRSFVCLLSDALYLSCRTVSLVSEEVKDQAFEILYDDIKQVEMVREEKKVVFMKKAFPVKRACLTVTYGEGLTVALPMHDDMDSERLIETIRKSMAEYRTRQEPNAEI